MSTDEQLWRSVAEGGGDAFEELYRRHARAIYNYLFRRLGDWSEAEDLTAIVFLEAFRRRRQVVIGDGKLLPWLYGVATNVLRNRRRSLWRHRVAMRDLHSVAGTRAAPDAWERTAAAVEMQRALERIRRLPREQQDVVALCIWSGLSYGDAAAALEVPVGTIRSRLSRARRALRELPGADGHELDVKRPSESLAEL